MNQLACKQLCVCFAIAFGVFVVTDGRRALEKLLTRLNFLTWRAIPWHVMSADGVVLVGATNRLDMSKNLSVPSWCPIA